MNDLLRRLYFRSYTAKFYFKFYLKIVARVDMNVFDVSTETRIGLPISWTINTSR